MKKALKKLSLLLTGMIMSCSFFACKPENIEPEKPTAGTKIGVITDLHIPSKYIIAAVPEYEKVKSKAAKALKFYQEQEVDAILFTGDLVSYGTEAEYRALDAFFTSVYETPDNAPKLIFLMGNHEYENRDNAAGKASGPLSTIEEVWKYHKKYLDRWSTVTLYNGLGGDEAEGSPFTRVRINGIQVVSISPDQTSYMMTNSGIAELKEVLDEAVSESNGLPIVAGFHFPLGDTAEGVQLYGYSPSSAKETSYHGFDKVRDLLKDYPQVVLFSGHTHMTNLSDRAITQDLGFTQVHTGMIHWPSNNTYVTGTEYVYANINSANNLFNLSGVGAINRYDSACQGILLTFGENSMEIDRVNFLTGEIYDFAETWNIPYGITAENKTEKFAYVNAIRKQAQPSDKLTFAEGSVVTTVLANGVMKVTFPSVQQINNVEGYKIVVSKDGEKDIVTYWSSNFILAPDSAHEYSAYLNSVTDLTGRSVKVYPIDFYGNIYTPLSKN